MALEKTTTMRSAATRSRIFEAAAAEFAEHGISGARVDRIAEAAGANKQLIYAYFGNKEELFATVLQRRLGEMFEVTADPEDIPGYVGELFDFFAAQPQTMRLLQWESLHYKSGGVLAAEPLREAYTQQQLAALEEAQRRRKIPPELDRRHLLFILWSMALSCAHFATLLGGGRRTPMLLLAAQRAEAVDVARRITRPCE